MYPAAIRKRQRPSPRPREHPDADAPGDDVERNSDDSFPASDPPGWIPVERIGSPLAETEKQPKRR